MPGLPGPFPRPTLRPGRATLIASRAPRTATVRREPKSPCWSTVWEVARPPPTPSNRNGGGVEHDNPVLLRTIARPAGQEASVEIRPRDPFVPFEQPSGDPMPGEDIEVTEGRFRHTVTEIREDFRTVGSNNDEQRTRTHDATGGSWPARSYGGRWPCRVTERRTLTVAPRTSAETEFEGSILGARLIGCPVCQPIDVRYCWPGTGGRLPASSRLWWRVVDDVVPEGFPVHLSRPERVGPRLRGVELENSTTENLVPA